VLDLTTLTLPRFEYLEPTTVEEALSMLSKYGEGAKVLAGGTDLLVSLKLRAEKPDYLVDITNIPNLDYVKYTGNKGLRIGTLTTLRAIEKSDVIHKRYPVLSEAAKEMGTVQVRNVATIGGNLCNASPAADMAPPLLVIDAKVKIVNLRSSKTVPVEKFFRGPGLTILRRGEMLTEILADDLPQGTRTAFLKVGRSRVDVSKVSVAVAIRLAKTTCKAVRIALGAVASSPIRARKAEKVLEGKELKEETINRAAQMAASEAKPISDIRSTAIYRKNVTEILVKRALNKALEQAR